MATQVNCEVFILLDRYVEYVVSLKFFFYLQLTTGRCVTAQKSEGLTYWRRQDPKSCRCSVFYERTDRIVLRMKE
jgi:hypothetical protein